MLPITPKENSVLPSRVTTRDPDINSREDPLNLTVLPSHDQHHGPEYHVPRHPSLPHQCRIQCARPVCLPLTVAPSCAERQPHSPQRPSLHPAVPAPPASCPCALHNVRLASGLHRYWLESSHPPSVWTPSITASSVPARPRPQNRKPPTAFRHPRVSKLQTTGSFSSR
jgi:hypothetical protein